MIVRNRLLNFKDCIIYQDNSCFTFSLDAVLLANFVSIKLSDKKIMDFACGNAPIPMLLYFRTKASIVGIDVQQSIIDLGIKSVRENGMCDRITLECMDINNVSDYYEAESFDVITCNPPYFKYNNNDNINLNESKRIARHEILIDLDSIIKNASYLLKNGGTFALVHRPSRLIEIITLMKKYNFSIKKMQLCYPKEGSESNLLLLEASKNGRDGMKILSPIIVHDSNGEYNKNIKKMFGGEDDVAE